MKARLVFVCVVLVAAGSLAGCVSKTGSGTGYINRSDSAPDTAVVNADSRKAATSASAAHAK